MQPTLEYLLGYIEKRFDAVDQRFTDIEGRLTELKEGFDVLQGSVDAYAKRADAYFQEMVVLSHKVERHERWLHQIAERLGVKLDY
jgi:CII-binding regulator of phage lambda lysogenization HflD